MSIPISVPRFLFGILTGLFLSGGALFPNLVHAQKKVPPDQLDLNNGLYYQHNHMEPFSGTAYEEYSNGQKKMAIPIKKGKIEGVAREWAPNGQLILEVSYAGGLKEGSEVQWFPQGGKRLEISNSADLANGMCYEWHRTGALRSEGLYENGLETGEHRWYYDDGSLDQIVAYKNGQPEGLVKTFYQNGQLKSEAQFGGGSLNGYKKEYYSDGTLRSHFSFVEGKENGEAKVWGKNGQLLERYIFEGGDKVEHQDYHSGSVRSASGYYQVFNEVGGYCVVHVTGEEVLPRGDRDIVFIVDGMILQLITTSIDKLTVTAGQGKEGVLGAYIDREADYIGRALGTEIQVTDSLVSNPKGLTGVHWYFVSPRQPGEEITPRTLTEEHYLSFMCGNRILSLYAPVSRSDDPDIVLAMLRRVGDSVMAAEEPIDLNALVSGEGD